MKCATLIILLTLFPLYLFLPIYDAVYIVAGPYVQNVNEGSVTIMWATNIATENNKVYWGSSISLGNVTEKNEKERWHEIKIDGLKESSKYFYKVVSDATESKIYSFYTPPYENFTFIAYGDTRGVWDSWKNASKVAEVIKKKMLA